MAGSKPMESSSSFSMRWNGRMELVTSTQASDFEWSIDVPKELVEQFGMSAKPPPIARARSADWD
jgi:hypothetical protein